MNNDAVGDMLAYYIFLGTISIGFLTASATRVAKAWPSAKPIERFTVLIIPAFLAFVSGGYAWLYIQASSLRFKSQAETGIQQIFHNSMMEMALWTLVVAGLGVVLQWSITRRITVRNRWLENL